MKAKVISVEKISNAQVNITFQVIKNDGTLLAELTRGFSSTSSNLQTAKNELLQSFKNIRDSLVQQNQSALNDAATSYLNEEVDIN